MAVTGLGYIGIGASDIAAWRQFAVDILGLEARDRADGGLDLRIDERAWRIRIEPDACDDILYAGWEVADAAALDAVAARIEASGTAIMRDGGALAAQRGVKGLARFTDPAGVVGELFWGSTMRGDSPFVSPAGVTGFLTGDQGLGHIVIGSDDLGALDDFYRNVLGFGLSDHIDFEIAPGMIIPVTFLHCNPRHHSYAFAPAAPGSKARLVHFMLQAQALDDVGFALDRLLKNNGQLALTLGRHSNDHMLSFYAYTPSGFEIEYGWGARTIEPGWAPARYDRTSDWGHHPVAAFAAAKS